MKEIEVKILEIDVEAVRQRLEQLGAGCTFNGEMHAIFFDYPDRRIRDAGDALRLRREGEEAVLAFKKRISKEAVKVMEEVETEVQDFSNTRAILEHLGLQAFAETRKFRTEFHLGAASIVIDDYQDALAHIPPFIEIETPDVPTLQEIVSLLGFSQDDCKSWDTYDLVHHYRKPE